MEKAININLPNSWEGLTESQLKKLSRLFISNEQNRLFDIKVLAILMAVKWYQFKKHRTLKTLLSLHLLADIKESISFIYKQANRKSFVEKIKLSGAIYYAPQPFLYNITVEEFSVVDDLFFRFRKATSEKDKRELLEYMAAVLYSKNKVRSAFNLEHIEDLRKPFLKADLSFLSSVLLTYQGCRFLLEKRYKKVFGGVARKNKGKKYGFGKIILQMAGGKFGSHQETKETRLHTFLEQFEEDLTPTKKK